MAVSTVVGVRKEPITSPPMDFLGDAEALGFEDLHIKIDPTVGLRAIIAIHSTRLGPALGGTRCIPYPSSQAALGDAMRLARAMSYKAAVMQLPYGGGKAVLIHPKRINDRAAYFSAYGRFIDELGGRFITAVDSGTTVADMDVLAGCTPYVRGTSATYGGIGDPSPSTAYGVRLGIEAAVNYAFGRNDLAGLRVAIQGIGHVGYHLAKELNELGAKLTVCDVNATALECAADEFQANVTGVESIYDVPCDVFAPCALGGVLNDGTIKRLQAKLVVGAANNQLADDRHSLMLHRRGILYAPDFVVNAGGLVHVVSDSLDAACRKTSEIYDRVMDIFEQGEKHSQPPMQIAYQIGEAILRANKNTEDRAVNT